MFICCVYGKSLGQQIWVFCYEYLVVLVLGSMDCCLQDLGIVLVIYVWVVLDIGVYVIDDDYVQVGYYGDILVVIIGIGIEVLRQVEFFGGCFIWYFLLYEVIFVYLGVWLVGIGIIICVFVDLVFGEDLFVFLFVILQVELVKQGYILCG